MARDIFFYKHAFIFIGVDYQAPKIGAIGSDQQVMLVQPTEGSVFLIETFFILQSQV